MNILESLNWRYATKRFDKAKKIDAESLDILMESMRLAPTSYGMQQLRVIHLKNAELRKAVEEASFGQVQVTEASDLFVIAVKKEVTAFDLDAYINLIAETRGVEVESLAPYKERIRGSILTLDAVRQSEWLFKQAYILLGFVLESAALLKIDACPMEGFDKEKVNKILNLDKYGLKVALLIPVGYRSSDDKYQHNNKTRLTKDNFFIEI